jgi:hypothetical protein
VPGARLSVQDRGLPGEVIGVCRRRVQSVLQPCHLHHVVAHGEAVQSGAAAAYVRQGPDLLVRVSLLKRSDNRGRFFLAVGFRQVGMPLLFCGP